MRISSNDIKELDDNQIFVFGSNKAGMHGAGAARFAMQRFGAVWGVSEGLSGKTYAIPTKDSDVRTTLPLDQIASYVNTFIQFAEDHPELEFHLTQIGCGYAGYTPTQIAPLFSDAREFTNILFPDSFALELNYGNPI